MRLICSIHKRHEPLPHHHRQAGNRLLDHGMSEIFTHETSDDTAIDTKWTFLENYLTFRQGLTGEMTRNADSFLESWVELKMECIKDNLSF